MEQVGQADEGGDTAGQVDQDGQGGQVAQDLDPEVTEELAAPGGGAVAP